jgi:hypothetical protein
MVAIRGGNWNNGANAGVFNLNLNNDRSNSNTNIGARPDFESPRSWRQHGGTKGDSFRRLGAKSVFRNLSSSVAISGFESQVAV